MPKARSKAKPTKGKLPLTRGRSKQPLASTTSASEVEDEQEAVSSSAHSDSHEREVEDEGIASPPASTSSESQASKASVKYAKAKVKKPKKPADIDEKQQGQGGVELIPDLVAELRGNKGTAITYVTSDVRHRQFELNARKELLQLHNELDMLHDSVDSSLKVCRNLCSDSQYGNVAEAVQTLVFPKTFKDLVVKLINVPRRPHPAASSYPHGSLFEDSEEELETGSRQGRATPYGAKTPKAMFASPAKMAKYATPKDQAGVFHFGGQMSHRKGLLSTNKAARLPKPGEVVFSESGSPIIQRRVPDDGSAKASERIEFIGDDGSKIEVDMVYRGNDKNKTQLRGFKEFAKEVRNIATTRSTVKQNRIQLPRINIMKGVSQSAGKKKPEWR